MRKVRHYAQENKIIKKTLEIETRSFDNRDFTRGFKS